MTARLIKWVTALWFFIFAFLAFGTIGATLGGGHLEGIDYARMVSKAAMASFMAMMGHLTLTRSDPLARAEGWQPRFSAFIGTNAVLFSLMLLKPRDDLSISMHVLSAALILSGNLLCIYVLSYLGRSFSIMPEARQFVAAGPYRYLRHPLYLSELVAIIGSVIQFDGIAWLLAAAQSAFQIARMLNEEKVLRLAFPEYVNYSAQTNRLIPGVW